MSPKRLLEHFDQISEAPDAIPRLRRFILDLAFSGSLTNQHSDTESSTQLLSYIRAEKRKRSGKEPILTETLNEDSKRFSIPANWLWIPATDPALIISDQGKKVQTKHVLESGKFPVVDQGKVFVRGYCNDVDKVIHVRDKVIIFGDHTRETKLVDFEFVVGADGVKILEPIGINPVYYFLALQWLPIDSRGYGRHFKILRSSYLPLAPLA